MEFGAVFILIIFFAVVAAGAVLLFGVGSALRRAKMHPEGDKIDGDGNERFRQRQRRPEHLRVSSEQRTRFIPDR